MKKKREVNLAFSRFFFRRVKASVQQARRARHARREKKKKNSRVSCAPRSLCSCLLASQKKTTLVMQDKKSLGKLKATLLKKKNLKKKLLVIEVKSSCHFITKITYFFIYNWNVVL